ncbi:AAA family ATPase [Thermovenabulum gondwanense]|uniref:Septum site-determining protein MinD n=1 Tax=Thermovenabulum gondwanense TaxID=520767 RepID=A0A162MB62_9FIRM|nr:carbon monoxide dehydrogenase accessory protein CooC [Thermovenabulum gondwanense]KYO64935.1 Septum site-determining protein MinD [Thermovenabulum gondwanense]
MKIAITGKGGVGKTTLAGCLAKIYTAEGKRVIAVDADPDANLAFALGFPPEKEKKLIPLSQLKDIIKERTGAEPGVLGQMFSLNPKVDDIPERYCVEHEGIKLIQMGGVEKGGAGCVCPESSFIKAVIRHLILEREEVLILDMEAGIEHLGRATASFVDAFIAVVEPGIRSIKTFETIKKLAKDLGIDKVLVVANKVKDEADIKFINDHIDTGDLLGVISYNEEIINADKMGISPYDSSSVLREEVSRIKSNLSLKIEK